MIHARFSAAEADPESPERPSFEDDAVEARAARRMEIVAELQDICLDVARALGREILARTEARDCARAKKAAEASPQDAPDVPDSPDHLAPDHLALAFSRVTRVLNVTLAQGERLDRDRAGMTGTETRAPRAKPAPIKPNAVKPAPAAAKQNDSDYGSGPMTFEQRQRFYRKLRGMVMQNEVRDLVTQAIHAQILGDEAIEEKLGELEAVLGARDDSDRFSEHPIGALAAAVCRHLGLTPDWSLWTQVDERADDLDDDEDDDLDDPSGSDPLASDDPEAAFTAFGPIRPERARAPP